MDDEPFQLASSSSAALLVSYRLISGPATLVGDTVFLTGDGTVMIEAYQEGNDNYVAADPAQQSFEIFAKEKLPQTLSYVPIPDQVFGEEPVAFKVTSDAGLPVIYQITGPVEYQDEHLIIQGAGTVEIKAYQTGNEIYAPSDTALIHFEVNKASQEIQDFEIKQISDSTYQLQAVATSALPVNFTIISGEGNIADKILTVHASGIVEIEAIQEGNINYLSAEPVSRQVEVKLVTAIEAEVKQKAVVAYPNPSKHGIFRLQNIENAVLYDYQITNGSGKVMQAGRIRGDEEIDISYFPSGTYILKLKHGVKKYNLKLVKL